MTKAELLLLCTELEKNTALRKLNLSYNKIDADGALQLAPALFGRDKNLTTLELELEPAR